jgi:hypothetical protein
MMRGVRGICCALLGMFAGWLHAQEEEFTAPPPPPDLVLDEARLFARNPERLREIAESLAALEEKHDFRFYFVLYDSLFERSLSDRAQALQQAWLGGDPGIVLVLETDSGIFKVGQAPTEQAEIDGGAKLPLTGAKELAPSDLTALVRGIEGSLRESADREDFSARLATGMATGISTLLDERAAEPDGGTRGRMIVLAIGLVAGAGLIALLVVAGLKRAEAKSLERYVFPKVTVGIRLGAPYGGGKVSSRSFGDREAGR